MKRMEINLEKKEPHSIQSYDNRHVKINHIQYDKNIIVNQAHVIEWEVKTSPLAPNDLTPLLHLNPEVILIGHTQKYLCLDPALLSTLSQQRIGIECMSLGAACRTFNVLLNEKRRVVLGLLFEVS